MHPCFVIFCFIVSLSSEKLILFCNIFHECHHNDEEVSYELQMREKSIAGALKSKRARVNIILALEAQGESVSQRPPQFDLVRETNTVRLKITKILGESAKVNILSTNNYQQFMSRYLHINNRT